MAVQHLAFNADTQHGRLLRRGLTQLEDGLDQLNDLKGTMQLMIDGDGSQAAHFTYLTAKFGFGSNDDAKAAWDELNSLLFKLNTKSQVSDVNAALLQAFSKFR
jgi:tetrahydromethanopterin S-methyltransferase subunit H